MRWKKQYNNHDDILTKRLMLSCADGNIKDVQTCLEQGADLHCTEPELGWTPLHVACYRRNAAIVELLLDEGANPNICASDGYAPLRLIVVIGSTTVVSHEDEEDFEHDCCRIAEALLEHGADPCGCVDARSGSSPLHVATQHGQLHMVELLIEYGAFFHVQQQQQQQQRQNYHDPSHSQITSADKAATAASNTTFSSTSEGTTTLTPLAIACRQGHAHVVDYLLHNVMPPTMVLGDAELMLPFREACRNYHVDCIVRLLRYGLEIMYESKDEHVDTVVEALLKIALDTKDKVHEEENCDSHQDDDNNDDAARTIIDPNLQQLKNDAFKMELFREACRLHMVDVIVPLLPHMDARAIEEDEEIHSQEEEDVITNASSSDIDDDFSAVKRPTSLRSALVEAVDPNNNQTVLHRVCAKKNLEWVQKLLQLARQESEDCCCCEDESDFESCENYTRSSLSANPLDRLVNAVDMDLQTALHLACRADFVEGVRCLLECSHASVNAEDINGNTPLMLAQREDVVRCLLELPKNISRLVDMVNRSNSQTGQTRLHTASDEGNYELCRVLLLFGADPNVGDFQGCTALYFASAKGFVQICVYLLAHGADPNTATATIAEDEGNASFTFGPPVHAVIGGDTPLHAAARGGHLSVLLRLFAADVHAVNARGRTPLHEACEQGHLNVVEFLVTERDARLNVTDLPDGTGFTPFELACRAGRINVIYYLLRYHSAHKIVSDMFALRKRNEQPAYYNNTEDHETLIHNERSFGRSFGVVPEYENEGGWGDEDYFYNCRNNDLSHNASEGGLSKFLGDASWGGDECCGRTVSTCATAEDITATIHGDRDLGSIGKVLENELSWEFWKNYFNDV